MNCSRSTRVSITASKTDLIEALKLRFPNFIDVVACPDNGIGVSVSTDSSNSVTVTWNAAAGRHD